jgi:hypothetical protein
MFQKNIFKQSVFKRRMPKSRGSRVSSILLAGGVVAVAATVAAAAAEVSPPDVRGTWKGDSETILLGTGNPHHGPNQDPAPQLRSVPFTLVIDHQDGRRFSGTFTSPRSSEKVVAVFSRDGTIYLVDDEGYTHGTMLAPDRMELCYMYVAAGGASRIASCAEMKKQP